MDKKNATEATRLEFTRSAGPFRGVYLLNFPRTAVLQRYGEADGLQKYDAYMDQITPKASKEQLDQLYMYAVAGYIDDYSENISRAEAEKLLKQCQEQIAETKQQEEAAKKMSPIVELTGQTDPNEQETVLNKQLRALISDGKIPAVSYKEWKAMDLQARFDLVCSVPEEKRREIVQKIKSEHIPGQILRTRRYSGFER